MANKIQIKRSSTGDATPTLSAGELGINLLDKRLFTANDTVVFDAIQNTVSNFAITNSSGGALRVGNSTVNLVANSTFLKITNSTVNTVITIPTSGQWTATNYFLHANGSWVQITAGGAGVTRVYQRFTATADQTTFTVSGGYTNNQIEVYDNGVHLANNEYTQNGTDVVLNVGVPVGDIVEISGYKDINISEIVPTPAGSNTEIQYNNSTVMGGATGFTYDNTANNVTLANTLFIGNSTVNALANSLVIQVANSTVNANQTPGGFFVGISAVNSTAQAVGANMVMSAVDIKVGNSTVNVLANSVLICIANSTAKANLQPSQLVVGTSIVNTTFIAAGANVLLSTVDLEIGNSTVNSFANSLLIQVANSTVSANQTAGGFFVGTSVVNSTSVATAGHVANSTGLNPTSNTILLGNSIGRWVITANSVSTQGHTANATAMTPTSNTILLGNSTALWVISANSLTAGGTVVNSSVVSSGGSILSANIQITACTTTTYTLTATDSGKIVTMDNGSASTVTVPAGLPIGFRCQVLQLGAGQVTLSNTGQTSANIQSRTAAFAITARFGSASVFEPSANLYVVDGLI